MPKSNLQAVEQAIIPSLGSFKVRTVALHNCAPQILQLLEGDPQVLGVAVTWNSKQDAIGITFSTTAYALFIPLPPSVKRPLQDTNWDALQRVLVQDELPSLVLVAFDCAKIALSLHRQFQLSTKAADLGNYFRTERNRRGPIANIEKALSARDFSRVELLKAVGPDAGGMVDDGGHSAWTQAWVFVHTGTRIFDLLKVDDASTQRLDTRLVLQKHLDCLSFMQHRFDLLECSRPEFIKNDFSEVLEDNDGKHVVRNERYSNKIRVNRNQIVVLEDAQGKEHHASAITTKGKSTTISMHSTRSIKAKIMSIRVIGKDDNTVADIERIAFILGVLQGRNSIDDSSFINLVWFSKTDRRAIHLQSLLTSRLQSAISYPFPDALSDLNPSQLSAAIAMLTPTHPIVVCHGPPGTGKTRTIASVVKQYDGVFGAGSKKETVWLCAQSNVGVKNIAEALMKRKVQHFKLLVSKEFHEEWHEHLYEEIGSKLIRLDEISEKHRQSDVLFSDVHIVLCTLGMLSNPGIYEKGIVKHVPVSRIIIDEASQIYIGQYMHLFHKFRKDIQKISFFGDPKQLPPFKSEDIKGIDSVFELKHLQYGAFFLNTQYRMPSPLGGFISKAVYANKLKSQHAITDVNSVVFVDSGRSTEVSDCNSWKNINEVHIIVNLVRRYYRHKDFCIITPYEPQRATIQTQLKRENLPWENVFTVDSYQGNEAEYVLISLVRTKAPGFLKSRNRVNVMLTRCKRGMVIVSNKTFIQGRAKKTLIGEMERHWKIKWEEAYPGTLGASDDRHWVDWRKVAQGTARLPGLILSSL